MLLLSMHLFFPLHQLQQLMLVHFKQKQEVTCAVCFL